MKRTKSKYRRAKKRESFFVLGALLLHWGCGCAKIYLFVRSADIEYVQCEDQRFSIHKKTNTLFRFGKSFLIAVSIKSPAYGNNNDKSSGKKLQSKTSDQSSDGKDLDMAKSKRIGSITRSFFFLPVSLTHSVNTLARLSSCDNCSYVCQFVEKIIYTRLYCCVY